MRAVKYVCKMSKMLRVTLIFKRNFGGSLFWPASKATNKCPLRNLPIASVNADEPFFCSS